MCYCVRFLQIGHNVYVVIKSFISDVVIQQSIGGVMVSIAAFQAVDLGSIPGQCNFSLSLRSAFLVGVHKYDSCICQEIFYQ